MDFLTYLDADTWVYYNPGIADLQGTTVSTTLEQSRTGTAFYNTNNATTVDVPIANEIWIKVDLYQRQEEIFSIYSNPGGWHGLSTRFKSSSESYRVRVFQNTGGNYTSYKSDPFVYGVWKTILLHLRRTETNGLVQVFYNGKSIGSKSKEDYGVNSPGLPSIRLYAESSNTLFSNIKISNAAIGFDDASAVCFYHDDTTHVSPLSTASVLPALGIYSHGKNYYDELVSPNDDDAGKLRLRVNGSDYAIKTMSPAPTLNTLRSAPSSRMATFEYSENSPINDIDIGEFDICEDEEEGLS